MTRVNLQHHLNVRSLDDLTDLSERDRFIFQAEDVSRRNVIPGLVGKW